MQSQGLSELSDKVVSHSHSADLYSVHGDVRLNKISFTQKALKVIPGKMQPSPAEALDSPGEAVP